MKTIIKNGLVLRNKENHIKFEKVDILVDGKYIVKIGKRLKEEADTYIDATNQVVMPGFINMHTHAPMKMLQGVAEGMNLEPWLEDVIWPLESKMTDKDAELATKMTILEFIDSGTTCFNDMYEHQEGILKAVEETGIRAIICKTLFGASMTGDDIENSLRFMEEYPGTDRIDTCVAVHQLCDISRENMNKVLDSFRGKSRYMHIHLAESKYTFNKVKKVYDMTPAEAITSFNLEGYNVLAAHCVQFDENDCKLLKGSSVYPIHNPISNAKLASGIAPIEDFIKEGVPVCVATDGSASNNKLNLLEELKFAALLQKLRYNNPLAGDPEDYLKMLSLNPSIALGKEKELGTLDEGKLADIITFPLDEYSVIPNLDIFNNLLYAGSGLKTVNVLINGEIVKKDNEYIKINADCIVNDFNRMVKEFYSNQNVVKVPAYKN